MAGNPRVLELLEEMLDSGQTPEEVCRDCPELLAEVRQRWKEFCRIDAEVGALLPEHGTPPEAAGITPVPPAAGLPQVPGYEVEAVLGRGGMGVVYKARHLALKRTVALKMLAGGHPLPAERARFKAEAEAVARLQHPHIVQIHEIGESAGLPFIALEFVAGGSLAKRLAGQPLPPRDAAGLVAALAEAMHLAHSRNLVHRDLKPANVLLTGGPDTPIGQCQPKVTDFGLSRQLDADSGQTFVGVVLGTPSYMAPEQAEGRAHAAGPAADVYALGAILYECLTGRPPFQGTTRLETLEQVRTREPVAPSSLNRQAPRDLETICLKCLRKRPERRYASARELAEDLCRFLEGKPVRARPVGVAERVVKWTRRRPAAAALLAALLVMSAAAVGTGLWLRQQEADRRAAQAQRQGQAREAIETALKRADERRWEEQWQEALLVVMEASTHLAEAGSPLLEERLGQAQSNLRIAIDLERVRESSPLNADGALDNQQRAAEYQEVFERVGLRIGDEAESVVDCIRASAIRDQFLAAIDDRAFVALMVNDAALVERLLRIAQSADPEPRWRDRFRDPVAWRSREQLVKLADDAFNTSPPPTGHQLALLGLLLRRAGAWSESTRLLSEACRRRPGNFWLNRELGNALSAERRVVESVAYYRAALALRPDNAGGHQTLGFALLDAGQSDEALAAFRRAVELSPTSTSPRLCLLRALAGVGRWKEAEAECGRALEIDPGSHLPLQHLAVVLWRHQRAEDAVVLLRKALEINPNAVNAHYFLGQCFIQTARHEEAVTAFRKVTELDPANLSAHQMLARELAAAGRRAEAIVVLQTAAARGPTYPELLWDLGKLLRAQGQPEEATKVFQKAATPDPRLIVPWDGLVTRPRQPRRFPQGDPRLIAARDALLDQGRFAEARAATERLLALAATEAGRRAQRRQLDLCDTLLAIEARIPEILAGTERPTEVATQRTLAEWCLKHKRLTATAVGFYTSAFSKQPSLADDLEAGHRFHAACAAALAGSGVGKDAAELDDRRRAVLRRQALDWLTAEHDAWAERHRSGKPGDRTAAATRLRAWEENEDLAGIRDEQVLARLTADERRDWKAFWAKVAAVSARDPVALLKRARAHIARREWTKAAACYAEGFDLEPTDNGESWFEYAAAQLLAGDRPGYRRSCAHMLARCQATPQMRRYLVARACTLAPDSAEDPEAPVRLALEELQRDANAFWSLTEQAALQIRAGRFEMAVPLLERSLTVDGRPGSAVLSWLWLALAYRQMGQAEEARRWLDKAAVWLDQQGGRMPLETTVMGSHPHNWLEAHALRQEAETLLRQAPGVPRWLAE
jgi:serine/threonine-protein kinase